MVGVVQKKDARWAGLDALEGRVRRDADENTRDKKKDVEDEKKNDATVGWQPSLARHAFQGETRRPHGNTPPPEDHRIGPATYTGSTRVVDIMSIR